MIVLTSEMVHTQISCSQNRNYQVGHCHVQNTQHAECQWRGLYKNTLHANHNVCNSHLPSDNSIFFVHCKTINLFQVLGNLGDGSNTI